MHILKIGERYEPAFPFVFIHHDLPALSGTDRPSQSAALVHQVPMLPSPTGTGQGAGKIPQDATTESMAQDFSYS